LLLIAFAAPLVLMAVVALPLFALGAGPLSLALLGFAGGAALARWSRTSIQFAVLVAAGVAQSAAYYASAYNVPPRELLSESIGLFAWSVPIAFVCAAAGRLFGESVLYRHADAIWASTTDGGPTDQLDVNQR
jgi:hypothetical protein